MHSNPRSLGPLALVVAALAFGVPRTLPATVIHKKFIELGWDIPSTSRLRELWREMEQTTPFDGVMFKVEARNDQGQALSSEGVWDRRPWKRAWLEPARTDLKACQFARFTANFLRFNATPGNLDWPATTWTVPRNTCVPRTRCGPGLAEPFASCPRPTARSTASKCKPASGSTSTCS